MDTFTPGEAAGPIDVPRHSKSPIPRRRRVLWCRDVIYIPSRDPLEAGYLFSVAALRTRLVSCTIFLITNILHPFAADVT